MTSFADLGNLSPSSFSAPIWQQDPIAMMPAVDMSLFEKFDNLIDDILNAGPALAFSGAKVLGGAALAGVVAASMATKTGAAPFNTNFSPSFSPIVAQAPSQSPVQVKQLEYNVDEVNLGQLKPFLPNMAVERAPQQHGWALG